MSDSSDTRLQEIRATLHRINGRVEVGAYGVPNFPAYDAQPLKGAREDIESLLEIAVDLCALVETRTRERDASTEALTALLEEKPLPNGQYVHHVVCSGDRRVKAGSLGACCCCLPTTHRLASQVAALRAAGERLYKWLDDFESHDRTCAMRRNIGTCTCGLNETLEPWVRLTSSETPE